MTTRVLQFVELSDKDRKMARPLGEALGALGKGDRPLVVHRMNVGDLPFHHVGKHRRAKLKDVLAFKKVVDAQQAAMKNFTEIGEWEQ